MAGTPPKEVTVSRSISSRARPASQRYMMHELPAGQDVGHQDRVTAGGVEQRDRQQVDVRSGRGSRSGIDSAPATKPARSRRSGSSGWCRCCGASRGHPWAARSCPRCRRSSRRRRVAIDTDGSSTSAGTSPMTSHQSSVPGGRSPAWPSPAAGSPRRTTIVASTSNRSAHPPWRQRRPRSARPAPASAKTTLVPESASPYSSSSPVHQALSGTTTAPAAAAAQNATDHSGRLRIAIATRSPSTTPKRRRRIPARWAQARKCSSKVIRSSS